MNDPTIVTFFEDKKTVWLKEKVKPAMEAWEVKEKEAECEILFSLEEWLPNAAKRAGNRAFSSHPSKFSHPSTGVGKKNKAKLTYVTPLIFTPSGSTDGFLRSGNVPLKLDSIGDAAALDVEKFLTLKMKDGKNLLSHLEADSDLAKTLFTIKSQDYESLKNGFLAMIRSDSDIVTSSKIKQVYFPVGDSYHLLSVLTPSGIVFDLRKRLDELRSGDDIKLARDKKHNGVFSDQGYSEIYGLTTIGYGGANPQNISVLNSQNVGKAHLLMSMPPVLAKREIQVPNSDFFTQSINYYQFKELFLNLHNLYRQDVNNMHVRATRDEYYHAIFERIVEKMWQVRSIAQAQFNPQYSQLKHEQKVWLLDEHQTTRDNEDAWLEKITTAITLFISRGYEKILAKKAIKLSDTEYKQITRIVEQNKEVLR